MVPALVVEIVVRVVQRAAAGARAIAEGQTVTRLYPATDYPRVAEIDDYGQPGKADAGSYVATLREQLFSATLQANKVDN